MPELGLAQIPWRRLDRAKPTSVPIENPQLTSPPNTFRWGYFFTTQKSLLLGVFLDLRQLDKAVHIMV